MTAAMPTILVCKMQVTYVGIANRLLLLCCNVFGYFFSLDNNINVQCKAKKGFEDGVIQTFHFDYKAVFSIVGNYLIRESFDCELRHPFI